MARFRYRLGVLTGWKEEGQVRPKAHLLAVMTHASGSATTLPDQCRVAARPPDSRVRVDLHHTVVVLSELPITPRLLASVNWPICLASGRRLFLPLVVSFFSPSTSHPGL